MVEMVERLRSLCRSKNTSFTKIEEAFGWGNGTIGKWKNAKNKPPIDKIQLLANELNVSVDYILTGENENKPATMGELTDVQREAMELIMEMSDEQLKVFIATLKATQKII